MKEASITCQFCATLNTVDMARHDQGITCSNCDKPFHLDRPLKVTKDDFEATVLNSSVPVLVDFYADWCGPCIMMQPLLDDVAYETAGEALVVKLNTDAAPDISQRYGVKSIPYFARFEGGEVAETAVGAQSKEALLALASGASGS